MDCRIGTDYQSSSRNMAYSCAGRKKADSHCPGASHQLGGTAVLLLLRQTPYATVAGRWLRKVLMAV